MAPDTIKGLIQKPHDRKKALEPLFIDIGVTIEHYWFGVGSNTLYMVSSMQDDNDIDLEAITMLVYSSGIAQSINMVKLMTSEEAVGAMERAGQLAYKPPNT